MKDKTPKDKCRNSGLIYVDEVISAYWNNVKFKINKIKWKSQKNTTMD